MESSGIVDIEGVMLLPGTFWEGVSYCRGEDVLRTKRDTENRLCWTCCCLIELGDSYSLDSISYQKKKVMNFGIQ